MNYNQEGCAKSLQVDDLKLHIAYYDLDNQQMNSACKWIDKEIYRSRQENNKGQACAP